MPSATRLADVLAAEIALEGPISVERFMALCLGHPTLGYYTTRDPLGRRGDFITAPEISQMFGELLGLWAVATWQQMGAPNRVALVELGPGRGTLIADALRAARMVPAFLAAVDVHLVEISPVLRAAQGQALAGVGVSACWHERIEDVPGGVPILILANEFFDALPIRQVVFHQGGWRDRLVGCGPDGALVFGLAASAATDIPYTGKEGDQREICPAGMSIAQALAARIVSHGGALLAIDYGYARSQPGDSLQALQGQTFADVLATAGEADLTAHVDFAALAAAGRAAGATAHPLLTQRALLERLGIAARAQALAAKAPARAAEVAAAFHRLTGTEEGQMGTLFKALCLSSPGLTPAAFDSLDPLIAKIGA